MVMAKKRPTRPGKRQPGGNPWPERLFALRTRLGLTQAQAASRIRTSLRAWSSWERGEEVPSPPFELLIQLLDAETI